MSRVFLLAVLVVLVALLMLQLAQRAVRQARRARSWPLVQKKPLSGVEQVLFHRLIQALPQYIVLAQVPLSRFLQVRKGRPIREWMNRIGQKSVDYLVCKPDFSIVAAIELDDRTHATATRSSADATKNRALAAAGVPLVRWHVAALPDFDGIRAMLETVLQDRSGGTEVLPPSRIEPALEAAGLQTTHVEASNDPTIFAEETRT